MADMLFLVPNASAVETSDDEFRDRLEAQGHTVTMAETSGLPSNADGMDLILVSSYHLSSNVGDKLNDVAVPVVSWENFAWDDQFLGVTPDTTAGTTIDIVDASHPLAAGLSGTPTVYSSSILVRHISATTGVDVVATVAGNSAAHSIICAEAGAVLSTGTAPARRVGLYLDDTGFTLSTTDGLALIDAAVTWALNESATDDVGVVLPTVLPTVL